MKVIVNITTETNILQCIQVIQDKKKKTSFPT